MLVELAGFLFDIETIYIDTPELCKEYIIDELSEYRNVDARIVITPEDIAYEREVTIREALQSGEYGAGMVPDFPEGYLETTAVYRRIADYISRHEACVFHGALIAYEGKGYLFTAKSGTGKTTHINNWLKEFPGAYVVNGDKPILRLGEDGMVYGFGTPWAGKEGFQRNESVMVKAIVLLERGAENATEKVTPGAAISKLLGQCYRPHDALGMKRALEMCAVLAEKCELYRLQCNMEQDSAKVAYEGMNQR